MLSSVRKKQPTWIGGNTYYDMAFTYIDLAMPILNIVLNQNIDSGQKQELLKNVSQAVVDSIGAPITSVRAALQVVDAEDTIVAGEIGQAVALIFAYILPGRTESQKQQLIAALSQALNQSIQVSDQDSRVIILDIPKEDMGVAGGISAKMAGR